MGKPRYPAHVVHQLNRYPAKWCEECGQPILPKVLPPGSGYRTVHLEPLSQFKKRSTCGKPCAMAKARRARWPEPQPEVTPAPIGGITLAQAAENMKAMGKAMREELPSAASIANIAPHFPTPDGLHASQLDNGGPYARPAKPERPMPARRQRPKPSKHRPIPDQIADFITGTKGRRITTREIAKAYDLTEPEADSLLGQLADEGRIRRRTDPLGRPEYESRHP